MSQKTLPPPDCVAGWDVRHVADWLRHNEMSEFVKAFNDNEVNGPRLLELNEVTIRTFGMYLPPLKIIKLLSKVNKSKNQRGGFFNKFRNGGRNSTPAVPDRDYTVNTCSQQDDEIGWGSDFDEDDDSNQEEENYDMPHEVQQSPSRRPDGSQQDNGFGFGTEFDEDDDSNLAEEENYDMPHEVQQLPSSRRPDASWNIHPVKTGNFDTNQYQDPVQEDVYEIPDGESPLTHARLPPNQLMAPARPPKNLSNQTVISKSAQLLTPTPYLTSKHGSLAPKPPARPGSNNFYRPKQKVEIEDDSDTYEAPNCDDGDFDDSDEFYAVVPEEAPTQRRPLPQTPQPNVRTKGPLTQTTNSIQPPPRPQKPNAPTSNSTQCFQTSRSEPTKAPTTVARFLRSPKLVHKPTPVETLTSNRDESHSSAVSKMKLMFDKKEPANRQSRLNQPPLPGKDSQDSRFSQPDLPTRKPINTPLRPTELTSTPVQTPSDSGKSITSSARTSLNSSAPRTVPNSSAPRTTSRTIQNSPQNLVIVPTRNLPNSSRSPIPAARSPKPTNTMEGYPWYHADLGREKAQKSLEDFSKDGAFLVRNSQRGGLEKPFTLSLWYNKQVRNLQMRHRKDDGKYALGTVKDGEQTFDTPLELIEYHKHNPLILARNEGKTKLKHNCPIY